jgi:hypothetical protein
MIEAKIHFRFQDNEVIQLQLLALPEAIRPIYFSRNEQVENKDDLITDRRIFEKFMNKYAKDFFAIGNNVTFRIVIKKIGLSSVFIYSSNDDLSKYSVDLLRIFTTENTIFGLVTTSQEYDYRNRLKAALGNNNIESWVGRNPELYIPGLYWMTLFSDELCKLHKINLNEIVTQLKPSVIKLGESHTILKLYENPNHWKEFCSKIDEVCENQSGIFSISKVRSETNNVNNFLELNNILAQWK